MSTHTDIHNGMDIIDSRDVIARLRELADERESATIAPETVGSHVEEWTAQDGTVLNGEDWTEDQENEYQALHRLDKEASGYAPDWTHGEALIRDSYFEEYAQHIGAINKDAKWPNDCIDWERTARELQYDYTRVDFDGVDYWVRS